MQTVSAAFTAEETDLVRKIAHNLLVSWKKETTVGNQTFTIGVSTIGGNDVIGINPGAVGGPGIYKYFDETDYVTELAWERELNVPLGGISKAFAEARLDNTSRRFLPHYMGGNSELFTAILPRRPAIINAGFNYDGIDNLIPQFAGVVNKQPYVNRRTAEAALSMADYIDFFQNKYVDETTMFTSQRSDVIIENILTDLGMSTAQYTLDEGINIIDFGIFEKGTRFSDIIDQIVKAENGFFYQDETGKFRFENRQHWQRSPHDEVQRIVLTGQVIDAAAPTEDHIINVVEVKAKPRSKQEFQIVFKLSAPIELAASSNTEYWVDFDDPMVFLSAPVYEANTESDGSGSDVTSSIGLKRSEFARSAKYTFINSTGSTAYITAMTIAGRPAKVTSDIYYRAQDDSSVTAYEERSIIIENDYIQSATWAESFALTILQDFAEPENIQTITIRAMPSLQPGDLISWQGHWWRIFGIRAILNRSSGFIQELKLLKRQTRSNFTIGVSTIGGPDIIAA